MEIKKAEFLKNPYIKTGLTLLAIPFFSLVLFNVVFGICGLIGQVIMLLFGDEFVRTSSWFMPVVATSISLAILVASFFLLKLKVGTIYKAIYASVPLVVVYVYVGALLYRWPVISYGINGLVFIAVMAYLYKTKKPWLYFYNLIFWTAALLIFTLLGGEI